MKNWGEQIAISALPVFLVSHPNPLNPTLFYSLPILFIYHLFAIYHYCFLFIRFSHILLFFFTFLIFFPNGNLDFPLWQYLSWNSTKEEAAGNFFSEYLSFSYRQRPVLYNHSFDSQNILPHSLKTQTPWLELACYSVPRHQE